MDPKASATAVAKIQAFMEGHKSILVAQIQDGKISCPVCNREIQIPKLSDKIQAFDMTCKCKALLRISNKEDKTDYEPEYLLEETDGHTHEVSLDADGNGTSSEAKDHSHRVAKEKVLDAKGHTHKLKELEEEEDEDEEEEEEEEEKDKPAKGKGNTNKKGKAKNKGPREKLNGGLGVESADKKAAMCDNGKDDEEGLKDIPDAELMKWFHENPNPNDDDFHENSEKKGWNNHHAEAVAYKFATRYVQFRLGGKSKGKRPDSVISTEEAMGIEVEHEHTPNVDDANKIVWDHLSEKKDSRYYTFLRVVEKAIEEGPESDLFKGLMKLADKMEK